MTTEIECKNYDANGLKVNQYTFVPVELQNFLIENDWLLIYDSYEEVPVSDMYKNGVFASQSWEYNTDRSIKLNISYEDDEKHTFILWWSENDSETFKLRKIRQVLSNRGFAIYYANKKKKGECNNG